MKIRLPSQTRTVWGLAGLFCLISCRPAPDPVEDLRLGVLVPMDSPGGSQMVKTVEMVAAATNDLGGLMVAGKRHKIVLYIEDTGGNPQQAVSKGHLLIEKRKVHAIIGPNYSRTTLPMAVLADRSHIPLISPTATHEQITHGRTYVFNMAGGNAYQARAMVTFARRRLQAQTAAVLYDVANTYAHDMAETFKADFETKGGSLVAYEHYATGATDFEAQLKVVAAAHPDVLFLPNYTSDVILQAAQVRRLGITVTLLGSDGWSPITLGGDENMTGSYFTHHWHPVLAETRDKDRAFTEAYQARYDETPYPLAALTYDSLRVLFHAMEQAGSIAPAAVQPRLAAVRDFPGITGPISYENNTRRVSACFVFKHGEDGIIFADLVPVEEDAP